MIPDCFWDDPDDYCKTRRLERFNLEDLTEMYEATYSDRVLARIFHLLKKQPDKLTVELAETVLEDCLEGLTDEQKNEFLLLLPLTETVLERLEDCCFSYCNKRTAYALVLKILQSGLRVSEELADDLLCDLTDEQIGKIYQVARRLKNQSLKDACFRMQGYENEAEYRAEIEAEQAMADELARQESNDFIWDVIDWNLLWSAFFDGDPPFFNIKGFPRK